MTVIKRIGEREPFSREKMHLSLKNTSDDLGQPLGEREIDSLINEVEAVLDGKDEVLSRHIYCVVAGVLYTRHFYDLAKAYTGYVDNAWKAV